MSGARIVVLGADGFIGRQVMAAVAAAGDVPVAAGRRGAQPGETCERLRVDVTDAATLEAAFAGAAGVVNCASSDARSIVAAAQAVYGAARAAQPVIVDLSSIAVYGSSTGTVDEDAPLLGDTGDYAAAKVEAESIARTYPRTVILRPGIVYGRGSPQWTARVAKWLRARRVGDLGATGDGICNLVHVDDVAAAAVAALRTPAALGRAYNLALPEPITWNDYFIAFAKALGAVPVRRVTARRLKIEKLAAIPLKVAEIAAGKTGLKIDLPPPIPPSMPGLWRQELRLDVRRVERELGLGWTPLARGLAEAAASVGRR